MEGQVTMETNKNQIHKKQNNQHIQHGIKFVPTSTITISVIVLISITFTAACSTLGGFNRSTAAAQIEKDTRYSVPATMTINIGARLSNAGADVPQKTADETLEDAAARAEEDFMQRQPQILVAKQLGYIKLYFENGELGNRPMGAPRFDDELKHWYFKARAEITDKGKALWTDLSLPVNEEYLPLAVRGEIDVTGLKDENQHMKSADFTYQWEANQLGKAFDPESDEFKQLPADLQEALQKTQFNMFGGGGNNTMDFRSKRAARAFFQKFDDGWRLGELYFM